MTNSGATGGGATEGGATEGGATEGGATEGGATEDDFTQHMQLAIISKRIDELRENYEQNSDQRKLGKDSKIEIEFNILEKAYKKLIEVL